MAFLIVAITLVLITSFFCSLSEAALLSSSRTRVHALAEHDAGARLVVRMKETIDRPVAAILILNTIAMTGGATVAGLEWERTFGGEHVTAFTTAMTIAVLVIGELLPKTIGVRRSLATVLIIARPLWLIVTVMTPVVWVVERLGRLLGAPARGANVSLDDLRAMTRLAVSAKVLGREEQMIIEAASRLPRILVTQIMIHREDMVFLTLGAADADNLGLAKKSMHSRLIVCKTGLEDIVGLVNMKDLLWRLVEEPALGSQGFTTLLETAAREPLYVDAEIDVSQLLKLFSGEHEHLAIVRDKELKVIGMVTLEDVVEELLGEVDDEYDVSPERIERLAAGAWRFGGGTLWAEASQKLNLPESEFKAEDMDLDGRIDVNDVAANRLRGKLRTGGVFSISKWRFKVVRMRRGKVLVVEAVLLGQPGAASIAEARREDITLS